MELPATPLPAAHNVVGEVGDSEFSEGNCCILDWGGTFLYGGFLNWYPQIIHFNRVFHYKPSILGYHYFWKHPYIVESGNSICCQNPLANYMIGFI